MRSLWDGTRLLLLTLLGLAGCHTPDPPIKPPKFSEEYKLPPDADRRYSQPPEYPKDSLNKDPGPKNSFGGPGRGGPGGPGGPGASNPGSPGMSMGRQY
ncbi:MAG TPA: hypothetical protein VFE78_09725 [Gemmataceae bacterium]|jgi:hypothetical protein|nr:hypothetical protein [Gemmataceae bacterium]